MDKLNLYALYITIAILFIAFLVLYWFANKTLDSLDSLRKRFPYKKKQFLLSVPERKVFEFLCTAIPSKYVVFPQVVLSNIINVNDSSGDFWRYHNKINRKTIDLVIFEKEYLVPVLAIEYDGATHNRTERKERDTFVDNALKASGINILHIKHEKDINLENLRGEVVAMLS